MSGMNMFILLDDDEAIKVVEFVYPYITLAIEQVWINSIY